MGAESMDDLIERRFAQILEGAADAIRLEVAWLRLHNFPVWVARGDRIVDAAKDTGEEMSAVRTDPGA